MGIRMKLMSTFPYVVCLSTVLATAPAVAQDCEGETFDSTFELIQKAIFENRGCTAQACHGAAAAGGLDLSPDVAYDNLIEQPSLTVPDGTIPGLKLVVPGQKDESLLFINLAAAAIPNQWQAPLRPMPIGLDPISLDELEALREWIEQGAPRDETVPGTGELLDACLPPAKPIEIEPLPVPPAGAGVQIRMPRWTVPGGGEDEVCFASYYDVTDQVPEEFRVGDRFAYNAFQLRQDPLSHHLITRVYVGDTPYDDPIWGGYKCRGGEKDGELCEPTDLGFCGTVGLCASEPITSFACGNYGPPDLDTARDGGIPGTQEASIARTYPDGVFATAPLKGLIVWNSHAFNLTDEAGKLEGWINFDFAPEDERETPSRGIFNTSQIFSMNVEAFDVQELCNHHTLPANAQLYQLSSHTHQRGTLFRTFLGKFACDGGPRNGAACAPVDAAEDIPDICGDSPCVAAVPAVFGECNGDGIVGVNDLIRCVNIALGIEDLFSCRGCDANDNGAVEVSELVLNVRQALDPVEYLDGEENLLYTSLVYNDPTIEYFEPPMSFPDRNASSAARVLTYCSVFDNGFADPSQVKRQSTSPGTPNDIGLGGPCLTTSGCTEGLVGELCSGVGQAERDASCDSSPGAGDGLCDGCRLRGGVTTEDEMFILMGNYFVR